MRFDSGYFLSVFILTHSHTPTTSHPLLPHSGGLRRRGRERKAYQAVGTTAGQFKGPAVSGVTAVLACEHGRSDIVGTLFNYKEFHEQDKVLEDLIMV